MISKIFGSSARSDVNYFLKTWAEEKFQQTPEKVSARYGISEKSNSNQPLLLPCKPWEGTSQNTFHSSTEKATAGENKDFQKHKIIHTSPRNITASGEKKNFSKIWIISLQEMLWLGKKCPQLKVGARGPLDF